MTRRGRDPFRWWCVLVPTLLLVGCDTVCGNGVVDAHERCDDGNAVESDGCTLFCQPTLAHTCIDNVCSPDLMISLPGGTYHRGDQLVTVGAFAIDRTEVTLAAYTDCVGAGACAPGPTTVFDGTTTRASSWCATTMTDAGNLPINCIDWASAVQYCTYRGARLPTEAEWQFAAGGSTNHVFPWGDFWATDPEATGAPHLRANVCDPTCVALFESLGQTVDSVFDGWNRGADGYPTLAPVASYPIGTTPEGVHDLAGNVYEWTGDWYAELVAESVVNPVGPATGVERVIRGGSWASTSTYEIVTSGRKKFVPTGRSSQVGFRCAMSTP